MGETIVYSKKKNGSVQLTSQEMTRFCYFGYKEGQKKDVLGMRIRRVTDSFQRAK